MALDSSLEVLKEHLREVADPELVLEYCGADNIRHLNGEIRCSCPIHKGDGPLNFSWDVSKGVWTCWSRHCGENIGVPRDAIALIQLCKNISFREALSELASLLGVSLDESEPTKEKFDELRIRKFVRRKKKQTVNDAKDEELLALYGCGNPNPYLISRGFSLDAIREFEVGYASDGEFKGRVVFPIRDDNGVLIGFGGRQANEDKSLHKRYGKYKMLADFSKGVLYGLHRAKTYIPYSQYPIPKSLVLVEGFLDVIRAWEYGALNVVGSLGTALTKEQVGLVVKYASSVVLAYDADKAGDEALVRINDELSPYCDVYSLTLPRGSDFESLSFDGFWGVFTNPARMRRASTVGVRGVIKKKARGGVL